MIVWYLYIAVLLQSGHPDVTYAYPFPTVEACNDAAQHVAMTLQAEANMADDANAAKAEVFCKSVDFGPAPAKGSI